MSNDRAPSDTYQWVTWALKVLYLRQRGPDGAFLESFLA
jgi:hypothetical protein